MVFALDVGFEEAGPVVAEFGFIVAAAIAWEASLALDLTTLVVGGSMSVTASTGFLLLGGIVAIKLVGVLVG